MKRLPLILIFAVFIGLCSVKASAQDAVEATDPSGNDVDLSLDICEIDFAPDSLNLIDTYSVQIPDDIAPVDVDLKGVKSHHGWVSPYALPYSRHCTGGADWHRMWINTAVLSSAFVGTLLVLECLPEDATSWNRAAIQKTPLLQRWWKNIFVHNPEIDHDKFVFNYVLHPYAGAAYFMSARSCGFSFWGSLLYSAAISTIGWEFGIEAFMERPSYQDIFITPIVGSLLGELMYKGKRTIVEHGYEMLGSPVLGRIACFFLDPVNEVVDLFRGNPAKAAATAYRRSPRVNGSFAFTPNSISLRITF